MWKEKAGIEKKMERVGVASVWALFRQVAGAFGCEKHGWSGEFGSFPNATSCGGVMVQWGMAHCAKNQQEMAGVSSEWGELGGRSGDSEFSGNC